MLTQEDLVGPWAGIPVAWSENDRFDEQTYRQDVARCCRAGVPGVYTGGSTGEFYAMELDEFESITRATIDECRLYGTPTMIGCTSTYTRGAIRRAVLARQLGAGAIQLALPFWETPSGDWFLSFFRELAAEIGDLPISIYDTQRTKKVLTLDEHRAVKEVAPGYIMVKAADGTVGATPKGCTELSQLVNVFVTEDQWDELFPKGAVGAASSIVYWNPWVVLNLWEHARTGNHRAVQEGCQKIKQLVQFLQRTFGPMGYTDTAYDRLGGAAAGFLKGGLRIRSPYTQPTGQHVAMLQQWYRDNFPEMLELEPE
jgi:dihydrodipicolinate synthase/N-acetylneuraminate lyase